MNNKKKTSRFDDLIDAARSRQQRDQPQLTSDTPTSATKSTDPAYTRTTIYLPKQLHRQLKATAVAQERQMSDIVAELVEQWLRKMGSEDTGK